MDSLEKNGIKKKFNISRPQDLEYQIHINVNDLEGPDKTMNHFYGVLEAICNDITIEKELENIDVVIESKYSNVLYTALENRIDIAKEQKKEIDKVRNFDTVEKTLALTTGTLAGTGAMTSIYPSATKLMTEYAEYWNAKSSLFAPLAGLAQLGGTSAISAVSFALPFAITLGFFGLLKLYEIKKTEEKLTHAKNYEIYMSIENAINNN